MNQLLAVVQYVQPEKTGQINQLKQRPEQILKDLVSGTGSKQYEELVERVCDDLLEGVNNQIDLHKRAKENPEKSGLKGAMGAIPIKSEYFQNQGDKPRIDHTIKKPQFTWWSTLDNTYYPFLPKLTSKPNGKYPLPEALVKAQKDKEENPQKYKQLVFGEHK